MTWSAKKTAIATKVLARGRRRGTNMLGVAVLGYGSIGRNHVKAVEALAETTLVCAADSDEGARSEFAKVSGVPCYPDYREALARADVDIVAVALPHDLHAGVSVDALAAGKHVLCEKPMAISLAECDAMLAAAKSADRKLMIGLTWHFIPATVKMREIIASGRIGRPIFGEDVLAKNWNFARRSPWFKSRERGGGMWLTNGIHQIDRLSWLIGDRAISVEARSGTYQHVQEADDLTMASLRFSEGAFASIRCFGYAKGGDGHWITIWGTDGAVRFNDGTVEVGVNDRWEAVETGKWDQLGREWEEFVRSISSCGPEPVGGEWGKYTVAVALAGEESSRRNSPVKVG